MTSQPPAWTPIGTREIKDLILYLRSKGKTILLCSHLLSDVEDVCQRVVVLYGGKRQAMGDIHDLLKQQNLTQITTERLNDETISRIQQLVERDAGKSILNITTPSDRLESFFLRIVREAQEAQHETSGAATSGKMADFLATGDGDGQQLIESLVAAGQTVSQESPLEPVAVEEPSSDIIDELVVGAATRPVSPTEVSPVEPMAVEPAGQEQPDRNVIDSLLGESKKK